MSKFLLNRKEAVASISRLLADKNFEEIKSAAHSMKGTCASYGLLRAAELADAILKAAQQRELASIETAVAQLAQFLDKVDVRFRNDQLENQVLSGNTKVLFIDDQLEMRLLLRQLIGQQCELLEAEGSDEGLEIAAAKNPDVILLDLRMPGRDGHKTCELLRQGLKTRHIPILILTAESSAEGRIKAFNLGADDYLNKPFSKEELIARIQSKLRRIAEQGKSSENTFLECGNLRLDLELQLAHVGDTTVQLTALEFKIMQLMLQNQNKIVSRENFLNAIWQGTVVGKRTVDTHVSSIRRKIPDFDHEIVMLYGSGYSLRPRTEAALEVQPQKRAR